MNLWVARGAAARAEAAIIGGVANAFISTKTSGPVNGQVQDSVIGCYELTRHAVRMDKYHAMALFAGTATEAPRFDERPAAALWTGREVVSALLRATPINYRRAPSSFSDVYAPYVDYDPSETLTVIEQGVMVRGVLDKRSVGAKASGGVFHLISREYGSQRALDLVFAFQQVALQFLMFRGFSVGIADLLPTPRATAEIRKLVSAVRLESEVISRRLIAGEIVPPIDSTVHDFYEQQQINALRVNEAEVLRWVFDGLRVDTNGLVTMIKTGSKGSNPNLIHISACINQTTINGARIAAQFAFRRTLPYYPRFSLDPSATGYVENSYITGMRTGEFIHQGMNGRFDLISKALSTASTGYFARKGVMNFQSCLTNNLRATAKDARVVQFLCHEDGVDPRELERVVFRTARLSDAELRAHCEVAAPLPDASPADAAALADACAQVRRDRDTFRRIFLRVEALNFRQAFADTLHMPVNVGHIVEGVFIAARAAGLAPPPVTAAAVARRAARVAELCARIPYTLVNEIQERRRARLPPHITAAAALLCILIRGELPPRVLALMSDEQLTFVIDAVRQRYSLSLINYGKAVGILAAQSISEPLTQYMLDSHHRSVAAGTNKAGLVRVSEIYGARAVADEQGSAMLLPLSPAVLAAVTPANAFGVAQEIANSIEYVTLRRFTRQHRVLLEPLGALAYPPTAGDATWIADFARAHPLLAPPGDLSNWCLRFTLDKAALVLKAVDLELIVRRVRARHPGLYVVHSPEAAPEIVIRAWIRASQFKRDARAEERAEALMLAALDTPVRGIEGIVRASAEKITRHVVGAGGALERRETYAVATVGTNLAAAMLHTAIDARRVVSNSVDDTRRVFGIEAARGKIISETRAFMEDNTPNLRHLYIYADEMTSTGRVTSVERAGLSAREKNNVLLRMSYGAPIQVVTDATFANARAPVYGIAAPLLLGALPQIGTTYNSFVVDEEFVRANTKSVDRALDEL
jgi:hypothetical protein